MKKEISQIPTYEYNDEPIKGFNQLIKKINELVEVINEITRDKITRG